MVIFSYLGLFQLISVKMRINKIFSYKVLVERNFIKSKKKEADICHHFFFQAYLIIKSEKIARQEGLDKKPKIHQKVKDFRQNRLSKKHFSFDARKKYRKFELGFHVFRKPWGTPHGLQKTRKN